MLPLTIRQGSYFFNVFEHALKSPLLLRSQTITDSVYLTAVTLKYVLCIHGNDYFAVMTHQNHCAVEPESVKNNMKMVIYVCTVC